MLKKGFKQLLAEANATIESVSVASALDLVGNSDVLFLDIREPHERQRGYIPGSVHAPRGYLEFLVDPEATMHNPLIRTEKRIILYCASGGRSTLAAKTLQDMGFPRVGSLVGGIEAWKAAGGELSF